MQVAAARNESEANKAALAQAKKQSDEIQKA